MPVLLENVIFQHVSCIKPHVIVSSSHRRDDLSRTFFSTLPILYPDQYPVSCLHYLLPAPRPNSVTSGLRSYEYYPKPSTHTNANCSFMQYGLSHYHIRISHYYYHTELFACTCFIVFIDCIVLFIYSAIAMLINLLLHLVVMPLQASFSHPVWPLLLSSMCISWRMLGDEQALLSTWHTSPCSWHCSYRCCVWLRATESDINTDCRPMGLCGSRRTSPFYPLTFI